MWPRESEYAYIVGLYIYIYHYESGKKNSGRLGLCLCCAEYVKQMVRMYSVINLAVSQKVWRISHTLYQQTAPQNSLRPMHLVGVMSE
jgi:hypothetical protein